MTTGSSILAKARRGIRFNEHIEGRTGTRPRRGGGSGYRSGRCPDWLKMKNPDAPAVKRKVEED
jgi:hypothetical protein